jgi:hypothetical protein
MGVKLSGFVHDINGNAQNNLTVELFERTDLATSVTSTSTDESGKWNFDYSTQGRYDVRIDIGGGQYFWIKYDDIIQAEQAEIGSLLLRGSDNAYVTTFTSTPTAARTVTVPDATFTLAGINLAQTFSANQTFTGTVTVGSDGSGTDVIFYSGTAGDNFTWDASEEKLTITGTNGQTALDIADGNVVVADDLTVSGNTTLNGNVTLGNAASDVITVNGTIANASAVIFEGATADGSETTLAVVDPTADHTIYMPNQDGYLGVFAAVSTDQITSTPAELNILDGATVVVGEINALDLGSTAVGNAIASKAVVLDSNLDYTGIRNLTITGTLSDGNYTFDTSGNVSGLGTVTTSGVLDITDATDSSDATGDTGALRTEGGASIAKKLYVGTDLSVGGNLTVSGTTTTVNTVTMNAANAVVFEGATADGYETTLTIEDPTADRTVVIPNVSGTLPVLAADSDTAITATPTELNILDDATITTAELNLIDGGTVRGTDAVGTGDGLLVNDSGTMKMTNVDTVSTYFASHSVGGTNIVTTGALDAGSITSNFGTINTGSSTIASGAITASGTSTFATLGVTTDLSLASQVLNCFSVQFNNAGGTLRHRMGFGQVAGTTASNFIDRISGASTGYTNTETGADADNDFSAGMKVSTNQTYALVFNTAAQTTANGLAIAVIQKNDTGTALSVGVDHESHDINGTTRNRMLWYYTNATSGAVFALNTTNIEVGKGFVTRFYGHLA